MTLYKIFKENEEKFLDKWDLDKIDYLNDDFKNAQLALIDGVIDMVEYKIAIHKELEQQFIGSINAIKVNIKEDNPHSFVIQNFEDLKDKLLAERQLINDNK